MTGLVRHDFGLISDTNLREELQRLESATPHSSQTAFTQISDIISPPIARGDHPRQNNIPVMSQNEEEISEQVKNEFRKEMMLFFVTSAIPFNAIENEHLWKAIHLLNDKMPKMGRRTLSTTELNKQNNLIQAAETSVLKEADWLTVGCDGWSNGRNRSILAISLVTEISVVKVGNEFADKRHIIAPYRTIDWTGANHRSEDLMREVEGMFQALTQQVEKEKIGALILDGSGECQKSLRILGEKYPEILMVWCVAHQHNLVLGDVLRKDPESADVLAAGTQAAKYLNANHKSRSCVEKIAKTELQFGSAGLTRWNSSTDLISRLSRHKSAIKSAAATHGDAWITQAPAKSRANAQSVVRDLETSAFWTRVDCTLAFLKPLSIAQDILQADWATLDTVVFCWGWLVQHYTTVNSNAARVAIDSMEMRWRRMDQVPYLLAFYFHPRSYAKTYLRAIPQLSPINLIHHASKLYKRLFKADPTTMTIDIEAWVSQSAKFNKDVMTSLSKHPRRLWNLVGNSCPDLSRLCVFLFSCAVTNATLERVFSNMGWQYAEKRKRLGQDKVNKMTKVCYHDKAERPSKRRRKTYPELDITLETMIPSGSEVSADESNDEEMDSESSAPFLAQLTEEGELDDDPDAMVEIYEQKFSLQQLFGGESSVAEQEHIQIQIEEIEALLQV